MDLNEHEKRVVSHSLTGSNRSGKVYRNYYLAGPGHHSWTALQSLVEKGAMTEGRRVARNFPEPQSVYFHATEAGAYAVGLCLPHD